MLIHRIAAQLYTAEALQTVEAGLDAGEDVTLAVSQSGRTLMAAAQFARRPRPTVYIVSGEDAADRAARSLAAYVGLAHVCRFPERKDYPWREQAPDDAVVAQRCEALGRIVRGDNCIMVASARALLRCVPPVESRYWESTTFAVGEEIPFDEVPQRLVGMGYTNAGAADAPGLFRVHGDTVEVFPAQEKAPVRIEFFGDEIDRIRRMVSSTGQTIGNEDSIEIFPCRELALTDDAVHNMHVALYRASQDDSKLAALLEMVDARIVTPELDRFLPVMYGQTVSPLAHVSGKALVVLSEPRSLFDDCLRAYEDIEARAGEAGIDRLDGLYVRAQQLDFGAQQRLNYVSLIRAGGAVTAELKIEQPAIAGSDNRFMTRIQEVVGKRYACVFAIPDRGARESMELTFGDEGITFEESLTAAPENAGAIGDRVGVAHGKMSPREVEDVMIEFATKKIDVLIATTIVESGIDNATANTLIIEDSQRLGLAQLYQLKGRVGRSATQAYAYFMFPGELPLTEEATARLTALSEFQDLGSGMRIAMRDLEIRGAGSLMGAEQHGNLSSVGFDLFTQMLGQAVAEARGDDDAGVEAASVGINLPADYFLSEEYLPAVDQRVLVYRKLAAAEDLESIDEVQVETEAAHGELPLAGLNLFNRARIRIRGERLGLESVTLSGGRITFLGVDVPKKVAFELKTRYGAVNFPKSRKLSVPYKAGAGAGSGLGRGLDANDGTGPVAAALMLLQQLGASDDD